MVLAISNKFRLFLGILLAFILCQSTLFAQISAPTSSYSSITEYTVGGTQDEIFVFCDEANVGVGELETISPDGSPGWDFIWTKWDSGTNSFSIPVATDNGSESTVGTLSDGRYRVNIKKGAVDTPFTVWVFNQVKNIKPSLVFDTKDCDGVAFTSALPVHQYPDINAVTPRTLNVSTSVVFSFRRDNTELQRLTLSDYDGLPKSFFDDKAFVNEADYTMIVTDECGFEYTSDTKSEKTYVVDATFTFDPATGEAPLEVSFETGDANATDYQWFFYQDEARIDGPVPTQDSLLVDIMTGKDESYTYLHPGKYLVKLIATNNDDSMNCVDIFTSNEITVEGSIFEVPNVFTPNGDGANDEFKLRLYSVKSYSVKIFNRWGRLVYEFQESDVSPGSDNRKSSKGWNGKINGKLASPGTYFYVVEAEGREEEGRHYTEKGSLTLLHNK
jgi:gliding motility-associated-like protein